MTLNHLLRLFPLLVVASLIILAYILSFNGLYGQDAHEYLRLSRVFFVQLHGDTSPMGGVGRSEMAGGYPMAGALLGFLIPDAVLALQVVSWIAAGASAWMFVRLLGLWAPGTSAKSRTTFTWQVLVLSPYFVRAGLTVMSDALGLLFFLAALFLGLQVLESGRSKGAVWAAVFAGLAMITRFTTAAFLLPFAAAIGWHLLRRRQFGWILAAALAGFVVMLPHFYFGVMGGLEQNAFGHSTLRDWSLGSFFNNTFTNTNGTAHYFLPNILYVFAPLAHPGFCLPVSLLFLMAKKTDFHHPSQRVLLICLAAFLFFIGGLPCQNMRYLLPAFSVLLLFLFPAWDRFFSYGFYFLKKLTWMFIGVIITMQVIGTIGILAHPLKRNRLETAIVAEVQPVVPPGSLLFTFDVEGAMRTYLPDIQIESLWGQRYADFPPGSFILFNESGLRKQWQGQNPMLNWDFAEENYELRELRALPAGWGLYEVG
ncbi:MAG TPA: glycosyltransferase family 39 protein, partial [Saprospiraceae bacterium]|nr:glycosyltransferase family 39 protein [Saprospiraceae bacterium]